MKLVIVRHGDSESSHPEGDYKRSLTLKGKQTVKIVALFLKKSIKPKTIISSPFLRALQTAKIFAEVLEYKKPILESETLIPGNKSDETLDAIISSRAKEVLIVGHNPHLSELTAKLVSDGSLRFDMRKAAAVCIDFPGNIDLGTGNLAWVIVPGLISP